VTFHGNQNSKWRINKDPGVIETLAARISIDFPDTDISIIKKYVRIRTFIRIKYLNDRIQDAKIRKRNFRKKKQFTRAQEVNLSESEEELSD
jgi:uncharacterized protein YwlG (UPF0340 family)